jgi:hypothetical protein
VPVLREDEKLKRQVAVSSIAIKHPTVKPNSGQYRLLADWSATFSQLPNCRNERVVWPSLAVW